ncbi:short-chain dehydrogenase protein [Rutstroemia sp. NJR-2017a WRK4]|nr:short-chain dehydrogenase protein [Rutstroemia sp. NJR-2017a WRK4]
MSSRYAQLHQNPRGPGDARPTAQQIVQSENATNKLTGKTILITGASAGLGVATAQALYLTGATLYLTARDLTKARTALGDLSQDTSRVHLLELDLNSLSSVRKCASEFLAQCTHLDFFIANAGIMAVPEARTSDGFESQFGVNHLGHFLLLNLLKPAILNAAPGARVVILSSIAHRQGSVHFENLNLQGEYDPWVAYAQSKTANLWTAVEWERRYGERGVHAFAVQPGGVPDSGLMQYLPGEVQEGILGNRDLVRQFKSVEQGAATTVYAVLSEELEGRGGVYLEDCQVGKAHREEDGPWGPGYAEWAYDGEKAEKLWGKSLELVGLGDEE